MATADSRTVAIVPLNGTNYPTWKLQCRMALMRDGLWSIVAGTEEAPDPGDKINSYTKFCSRRDRALATIVLSIEPSLLYLLGDPDDPVLVWNKLANQFQKKTWANKLALRKKLYSLKLRDGESVQEHIKAMVEVFDELSIIGDPIEEEDRVVHILASLPESFDMLVTALEANENVPRMEVVTERLIHEERKIEEKFSFSGCDDTKALVSKQRLKGPKCNYCGRFGHIKKYCREFIRRMDNSREKHPKQKANKVSERKYKENDSSSESEGVVGLVVSHALVANISQSNCWIVDSGATCHMCNDNTLFEEMIEINEQQQVSLGDGWNLNVMGKGTVVLQISVADKQKKCKLEDVLYVPKLSYNLLSISKAIKSGKSVKFNKNECQFLDKKQKVIAAANKVGDLYYLNLCQEKEQILLTSKDPVENIEFTWHRRFGHLGSQNLEKLAKKQLVKGFNYNSDKKISFCESCVQGKQHREKFPKSDEKRSSDLLELVHSDVCGKMEEKSLSGAVYFLTFIDDKSRYTWTYFLKHKSEVFGKFKEWIKMVEKSTGKYVKTLRSDNGGEYTSDEFNRYLKERGIRHEFTVPKTPEQNGVAERMNRTLVEMVRSMLSDSKLPKKFWAEALSTATYIRNRSPAKAVKDGTPYEVFLHQKPDVKNMKIFGCVAYAHIAKDERKKLDQKARKCIFLGYGQETKGYRLYNIENSKIIYSRDVTFNESEGIESVYKDKIMEKKKQSIGINLEVTHNQDVSDESSAELEVPIEGRPERVRNPPNHYGEWIYMVNGESADPIAFQDVLVNPNSKEWKDAMDQEIKSLIENKVWDLVELPPGRKIVGSKWVFKRKIDADGKACRYKARLVAQGCTQKFGIDYDETFSPVVRFESVRAIIGLAVKRNLQIHQMDITTAFLNGKLKEDIFMKQPEGYAASETNHLVCKLKKSIYGLKQSPRCWNEVLDRFLKEMNFNQSTNDPCIYTASGGDILIIAVYVDDIILAGENNDTIKDMKIKISETFNSTDIGELHDFLGVKIIQQLSHGKIWIGQPGYAENILIKFKMEESKSVDTPVDVGLKLAKANEESNLVDQHLYQSAVGSLLYLAVKTRPDIAFAVNNVARFCAKPTAQHWSAVKRIFRYLNGTKDLGLLYSQSNVSN